MNAFEWDSRKAAENFRKHGVDFADAVAVFEDDLALTIRDASSDEERFVTMGADSLGRVLVVIYCWRGSLIRVISARRATRHERSSYQEPR